MIYRYLKDKLNKLVDFISDRVFGTTLTADQKHEVIVGLLTIAFFAFYSIWVRSMIAINLGFISAIFIGFLVEILDHLYGTGFSKKDMFINIKGGFKAYILIIIIGTLAK